MYKRYFELVNTLRCKDKGFYFQTYEDRFLYKNAVVGIHSLDKILPNLCDAIGVERRRSHCLRVTLATNLFNKNVDEKLIRERTGHTSNALFLYEKASKGKQEAVSSIVGPVVMDTKNVSDVKSEFNGNSNTTVQSAVLTRKIPF
jgi:integrase